MPRAPFVAVALSLLAFLSPTLTLAPTEAALEVGTDVTAASVRRPSDLEARPPHRPVTLAYQPALDAAREAGGADGVTFAVVRDGKLVWTGSSGSQPGGVLLDSGAGMVIGSVTKTFVAAVVLQLVEEGRVGLDEALGDLLPRHDGLAPTITVRELLDHTSGIADLFNPVTSEALEDQPAVAWGTDELLDTLEEPWHPPGGGWSYANTNYYLLGLLVERVTGRPLADEIHERISGPLGLTSTRVLSAADHAPLSPAWATIFWASGAMTSTAADLARWGDALYRGEILGASTRAAMLDFNDHDYGLGAQRIDLAGQPWVGHTGLLDTYTTLLVHLPSYGITLAMLVNRPRAPLEAMITAEPPDGGPSLLELARGRR